MVDLVRMTYGHSGADTKTNSLGQRPMQARVYEARAAQFLLLKAPPAAGKSRALMFLALDKLENQGVKKWSWRCPKPLSAVPSARPN